MSSTTVPNTSDSDEAANIIKQEINELANSIRLERTKHNEYKLIKDVAFECTKNDCGLSTELQTKIYNILMAADISQSVELANKCTLLGLTPTDPGVCDITYEEKQKLREAVEQELKKKRRNINKELVEFGISIDENVFKVQPVFSLNTHEKVVMEFKQELNEKQELCVKYLKELIETFAQIINFKTKTVPELSNQKIQACEMQSKLFNVKVELMDMKTRVCIFAETNKSVDAYREVLNDIRKQQEECKQEIEKLEVLKEKYKQVSCKQYGEILKSYLYYKSNIEKKKLLQS